MNNDKERYSPVAGVEFREDALFDVLITKCHRGLTHNISETGRELLLLLHCLHLLTYIT